jgi:phage terminase large subunit
MLKLTKVFHKTAQAYLDGYRYVILQGGTSASKTFSTLQLLTEISRKHKKQTDVVGLTVPHLKMGVLNDMPNVMEGFGIDFNTAYNTSDKFYAFPNAGTINFLAVDKLGKAHGGRRDILYLNEANHHIWAIAEQLMIRTRDTIFIDYNPTNEFWVHEHIMNNPAEAGKWILIKSNYQDNQFLEPSIVQAIEAKKGDGTSNFWRVYGMGELGIAEGLVFNNFEIANFDIYKFSKYRNGIDWGFSNDPFAFTRSAIENDTLYICQEIYQRGLLNVDSADMVRPIVRAEPVYCDSAEPKSVMEYNSFGIKAHSAKKGPGSIEASIKKMQTFRNIVIHKDNCPNTVAEFKNYQWKKDKNGKQLPQPEDGFDHAINSIWYALSMDTIYTKPNPITKPYTAAPTLGRNGWMR